MSNLSDMSKKELAYSYEWPFERAVNATLAGAMIVLFLAIISALLTVYGFEHTLTSTPITPLPTATTGFIDSFWYYLEAYFPPGIFFGSLGYLVGYLAGRRKR